MFRPFLLARAMVLLLGLPALAQSSAEQDISQFLYMLETGQIDKLEQRIRWGGVWGLRDFKSRSATRLLSLAAARGYNSLVRLMLEKGTEVNAPGELGFPALVAAATGGHVDTLRLLLSKGARVNIKAESGVTPLIMAAQFGNTEAAKLLLSTGADPKLRGYRTTALIEAAKANKPDLVALLLDKGAKVNEVDDRLRDSALIWAAYLGNAEVVRVLLEHKASLKTQNLRGETALDRAKREGKLEVVRLLQQAGATEK